MTCTWLGHDMASRGLVGSLPETSIQMDTALSDRVQSVEMINRDGIFDESQSLSILHGTTWRNSRIEIADDSETVLRGIVTDGTSSGSAFILTVQSLVSSRLRATLDTTLYAVNPAFAILTFALAAGVPESSIDTRSIDRASAQYDKSGIKINAVASKAYSTSLMVAINALAEMGCLRVWFDDKLRIALIPRRPTTGTYLLMITRKDIIGEIEYGATEQSARMEAYSLGYLGDSSGSMPATGGSKESDAATWSGAYNAASQWQLVNEESAHALGRLRLEQDVRRRIATVLVRDNGTIPVSMGNLYLIKDAPWGGNPGWLTGHRRKNGILTLSFLEVV